MKTIVILLFMVVAITAENLPSNFKICKQSDPNLNKCISEAVKIALDILAKGDRALQILPLEPLVADYALVESLGPVTITQEFRNMKMYGTAKNSQITIKNFDKTTLSHQMKMFVSQFDIISDYKMNGRILLLPIQGEGKCRFTLYNVTMMNNLKFETYKRDGETYVRHKKFHFDVKDVKDVKMYFENLFNGNPKLGEEMSRFLNENSIEIFNEIKPTYANIFKQSIVEITDNLLSKIPLKSLLPSN